jgi:hypothetical protein
VGEWAGIVGAGAGLSELLRINPDLQQGSAYWTDKRMNEVGGAARTNELDRLAAEARKLGISDQEINDALEGHGYLGTDVVSIHQQRMNSLRRLMLDRVKLIRLIAVAKGLDISDKQILAADSVAALRGMIKEEGENLNKITPQHEEELKKLAALLQAKYQRGVRADQLPKGWQIFVHGSSTQAWRELTPIGSKSRPDLDFGQGFYTFKITPAYDKSGKITEGSAKGLLDGVYAAGDRARQTYWFYKNAGDGDGYPFVLVLGVKNEVWETLNVKPVVGAMWDEAVNTFRSRDPKAIAKAKEWEQGMMNANPEIDVLFGKVAYRKMSADGTRFLGWVPDPTLPDQYVFKSTKAKEFRAPLRLPDTEREGACKVWKMMLKKTSGWWANRGSRAEP